MQPVAPSRNQPIFDDYDDYEVEEARGISVVQPQWGPRQVTSERDPIVAGASWGHGPVQSPRQPGQVASIEDLMGRFNLGDISGVAEVSSNLR